MFGRNLENERRAGLGLRLPGDHAEPFDVEETPLVNLLYSITRGPVEKAIHAVPQTRAEKRAAAQKLLETPLPPAPALPKGMARPWRGPHVLPASSPRRSRGG